MRHSKFYADEPKAELAFPLAELTFYRITLTLVISKLGLRFCDKFWIILPAAKARTTQANAMVPAESPIGASPIDLIRTDQFRLATVAAASGPRRASDRFFFRKTY